MNKIPLVAALAGTLAFAAFPSNADQLKVKATALSQADAAALQASPLRSPCTSASPFRR